MLERYHRGDPQRAGSIDELLGLLDAGWRRGGFGGSDEERQLHEKASAALRRYHERFRDEPAEPVWFEKPFTFRMGRHMLRGRVDRVDRLPDGRYELIDYKTGPAARARRSCARTSSSRSTRSARARPGSVDAARQSYLYVLDDEKVPVPTEDIDRDWISETVFEVADGILGQGFEPTPSYAACSMLRLPDRLPGGRALGQLSLGPRWRRKRWNSRAMTSPEGRSVGSRSDSSSSAARSRRSTKACTSGSLWTASDTWRS